MIKQLGKHDTMLAPFLTVKNWSLGNISPQELLLTENTGSEEPVALEYMDYSLGATGSLNRECNIALEQQSTDLAISEEGISGSGKFFPDQESVNQKTNTYKRLIHDQIYRAFYNTYNNPLKIFGIDNIDFPLSNTKRYLANDFLMFTIPQLIFGERVRENTVFLYDHNLDDNVLIKDDGNGNLIARTNLFSKIQEVRSFTNYLFSGSVTSCNVVTGSAPSGSITLTVMSGSAILDWNSNFSNEDEYVIEKSSDGISYSEFTTTGAGVTYYVDEDVSAGNTYWYRVYGSNAYGTSSYSNTASIAFDAAPTGSCDFDPDILSSSYQIDGYFDGMIGNPTVDPTGIVWDGTFQHYWYFPEGDMVAWAAGEVLEHQIDGGRVCNIILRHECIAGSNKWTLHINYSGCGDTLWLGEKIDGTTPTGLYNYTSDSVGNGGPATLTISAMSSSATLLSGGIFGCCV